MIKLIASDLDGTLLDKKGHLPEQFFEVIDKLERRGIKFVIASGRSYPALEKMFSKIDAQYICDNGAFVVYNQEVISLEVIDQKLVLDIIKEAEKLSDILILLCGKEGTYHKECDEEFLKEVSKYYVNRKIVADLSHVSDEIFKIAICDKKNPANHSFPILRELFGEQLAVQISGKLWVDFMKKGIDKGIAMKKLQDKMGIKKEETMAFGDYYNDIPLLKQAKYSFAMENANEDIKRHSNLIAKSNEENGVIIAIEQLLDGQDFNLLF